MMGKFFEVDIFICKYISDYSQSIPIKNNFGKKTIISDTPSKS